MREENSDRPVIGITMGDAAGIGPEIALKSLADEDLRSACRYVIIGDAKHLREICESQRLDLTVVNFRDKDANDGAVEVFDLANLPARYDIGRDQAETGRASAEYIEAAVQLWRDGRIDAIATAPISKRAIALGGYNYPGHTEFLADLTDTEIFSMSFFADMLRVVLVTTHVPLIKAIELVTTDALVQRIQFADETLEKLLGRKVKVAVAGLNPHASEGGMFGTEEAVRISPAIEHCRDVLGIDVSGPYSPDTIFLRGFKGEFDAVIALYHDQATIAVKSLSFGSAVNVTLGLPLVRTSVDHGTAYDIAGSWSADESSMKAAIRLAGELVGGSQKKG